MLPLFAIWRELGISRSISNIGWAAGEAAWYYRQVQEMFNKVSVKGRIVFGAGFCVFAVILVLLISSTRLMSETVSTVREESIKTLKQGALDTLQTSAQQQADVLAATLRDAEIFVQMLTNQVLSLRNQGVKDGLSPKQIRENISAAIKQQVLAAPQYIGVGFGFDINSFIGEDEPYRNMTPALGNERGRFAAFIASDLTYAIPEKELENDGSPARSWFHCSRVTKRSCVVEPFPLVEEGVTSMLSGVAAPIVDQGNVIGVVGVVISLDSFQTIADSASSRLFSGHSTVTFVSPSGLVAARSHVPNALSKPYSSIEPESVSFLESEQVTHREHGSDTPVLTLSLPFTALGLPEKWRVMIDVPTRDLMEPAELLTHKLNGLQAGAMSGQLVLGSFIALAGLYCMWLLAGTISRPLVRIAERLKEIASGDGDLRARLAYDRVDELGEVVKWFNAFLDKLQPIIGKAVETANETKRAAGVAASVSNDTNAGMRNQLDEVDQVATAANEMSATSQEVARNASLAAASARKGEESAQACKATIESAAQSIQELAQQMVLASRGAQSLVDSSEKIGAVLEVIRSVADQTNLLALNAAIEAARAGESGRGFAVVADEVRNLAKRTQDSVVEIHHVIDTLQHSTRSVVSTMQDQSRRGEMTVLLTDQAVVALSEVDSSIKHIAHMNIQIASAAEEQSAVSEEVNRNVQLIRDLADSIAVLANESAAASQRLDGLAADQRTLMGAFKF